MNNIGNNDKKIKVQNIFDSISKRYDLLNHLLSAGIDIYWRKKALKLTKLDNDSILLDVACGTGDFSIEARKFGVTKIFGADLSINMLQHFTKKTNWSKGNITQCVAENLPYKNSIFTNIVVAFGVRNFYDIFEGFKSFNRVLRENGKVTILEFRLPKSKFVKNFYMFYFYKILPFIGRIISKDEQAYTYLPESVGEFDQKINLEKLLLEADFTSVEKYSLTFGLVQVVIGKK